MDKRKIVLNLFSIALFLLAALVFAGTAAGEVSREGLVGEWHFDGDAKRSKALLNGMHINV